MNALGIRRITFAVDDIGEVVQYEDTDRLCYIRGPEGIIVGLAEQRG